MATYFSAKKHVPLPTGVDTDDVAAKILGRVSELQATVETLASTHPTTENQEASRVLSACKTSLFKTLSPGQAQTPETEAAATPIVEETPTMRRP